MKLPAKYLSNIRSKSLTIYVLLALKAIVVLVIIKSFIVIKDNNNLTSAVNSLQLNMLNIQQSLSSIIRNSTPEYTKIDIANNQLTITLTTAGAAHGLIKDCLGNSVTDPVMFNNVLTFDEKITCETKYSVLALNNINSIGASTTSINSQNNAAATSNNFNNLYKAAKAVISTGLTYATAKPVFAGNKQIPAGLNFTIVLSSDNQVYSKPHNFYFDAANGEVIDLNDRYMHATFSSLFNY